MFSQYNKLTFSNGFSDDFKCFKSFKSNFKRLTPAHPKRQPAITNSVAAIAAVQIVKSYFCITLRKQKKRLSRYNILQQICITQSELTDKTGQPEAFGG